MNPNNKSCSELLADEDNKLIRIMYEKQTNIEINIFLYLSFFFEKLLSGIAKYAKINVDKIIDKRLNISECADKLLM